MPFSTVLAAVSLLALLLPAGSQSTSAPTTTASGSAPVQIPDPTKWIPNKYVKLYTQDTKDCPATLSIASVVQKSGGGGGIVLPFDQLTLAGKACKGNPKSALRGIEFVQNPTKTPSGDPSPLGWTGFMQADSVSCSDKDADYAEAGVVLIVRSAMLLKPYYNALKKYLTLEKDPDFTQIGRPMIMYESKSEALKCMWFHRDDSGLAQQIFEFVAKMQRGDDASGPDGSKAIGKDKEEGNEHDKTDHTHGNERAIGTLQAATLAPLCPCADYFPASLAIEPPREGTAEGRLPSYKRKPGLKFKGRQCASSEFGNATEVVEAHEKRVRGAEGRLKRLMFYAVMKKTMDERKRRISKEEAAGVDGASLEKKIEGVEGFIKSQRHVRKILGLKKGGKCGTQSIPRDAVVLIENFHVLLQLDKTEAELRTRLGDSFAKLQEIVKKEEKTAANTTVHVFMESSVGVFDVCTYTPSSASIALVKPLCGDLKPLGKGSIEGLADKEDTASGTDGGKKPDAPLQTESPEPDVSAEAEASTKPGTSADACFPASARVETRDGRLVRMDEVSVGDVVRDGYGYSKILMLTHADAEAESEFIQVATEDAVIVLSAGHYLPVNGSLQTAGGVKKGDEIRVCEREKCVERKVGRVEKIREKGLYNPQTGSGRVLVFWRGEGVVTSCYTQSVRVVVASLLLAPLRFLDGFGVVVPALSRLFVDGSLFWASLLPAGERVEL